MSGRPLVLIVLDGWGLREPDAGNAIASAGTPHWDQIWTSYPHSTLCACGDDVGLPQGQMGNSEVGHLNLGAGRVVYQDLLRISRSVADGSFYANPILIAAFQKAKEHGKAVHLIGLLSDGGVHSHIDHLFALIDMAARLDQDRVFVHAFLDGRDVPPSNALGYVAALEAKMKESGRGKVATVMGRYFAMDRDKRWERTARAYKAMVYGDGIGAGSAGEAIEKAYQRGETDEFVQPTVIVQDGEPVRLIESGDSVVFFNFRPDRARQLSRALVDADFAGFDRGPRPVVVNLVCFTLYDQTIDAPVAFDHTDIKQTLGEVLSREGLRQLRLAETEKYAHVTFFFNGGVETPYPGEDRILIPSPQVATYDLRPEMSANEVTDALIDNLDKYDVVIMNFANPDMVGHTGNMAATIKAVETVDACLGRIVPQVLARRGIILLTGDHGNADKVREADGSSFTAHTLSPVPFVLISGRRGLAVREGRLEDVAPTILDLLGLPRPAGMTGRSLIVDTKEA